MTIPIRIAKLTLLLLLVPTLAWGLTGKECMLALESDNEPMYYWKVKGSVHIYFETKEEAEWMIPSMENYGYFDCFVVTSYYFGFKTISTPRVRLTCSWCQGEELK